ncbi:MAG: UDP-N-acetylmuramate dehydrogenase [Acidobacteria bacterium]|nr:UDP-N-acetylmuramate dehydrogenase [Acidobacteriota bacterium]
MKKPGAALSIRENVPLAPYTTLGVGGAARFLASIRHEDQIPEALEFARARACPVFVFGGGSNILVSDAGYPGMVFRMEIRGIWPLDEENGEFISVAAGEMWDGFVQRCVDQNLAGVECLSGIPGTVGAAPVQNIGAYGQEISDVIVSIRVLDRETCAIQELSGRECGFNYRESIFNSTGRDRYIILKVAFSLRPFGRPRIRYTDLEEYFRGRSKAPNIGEVRRAVVKIRESKGMVLNGTEGDIKSAGSFFKNPILEPGEAGKIENSARDRGHLASTENLPRLAAPGDRVKLPAAWFVERAGFQKGYTLGNVGVSSRHPLALVNNGGAQAREFIDLMHRIREKVQSEFGLALVPEPTLLGFLEHDG